MTRAALIALACAGCAHGAGWRVSDGFAQIAFASAMTADVMQTPAITERCDEWNPVIGTCGGRVPPPLYLAGAVLLELVTAYELPESWRRMFEGASVAAEASVVEWNRRNGYTLDGTFNDPYRIVVRHPR